MRMATASLTRTAALFVLAVHLGLSCSEGEPQGNRSEPGSTLPGTLWDTDLSRIPNTASVAHTRAEIPQGEEVVVSGRVREFDPDRAVLTIVDEALESCGELGESCSSPWDFCHQPKERVRSHSITIEFRDESGRPFATSLKGFGGLDPLTPVRVRGVVERDEAGQVVLASDRIYFKRR